jgi:hypothetical protein
MRYVIACKRNIIVVKTIGKEGAFLHPVIEACKLYRLGACRVVLYDLPQSMPCFFLHAEKAVFSCLLIEINLMCHNRYVFLSEKICLFHALSFTRLPSKNFFQKKKGKKRKDKKSAEGRTVARISPEGWLARERSHYARAGAAWHYLRRPFFPFSFGKAKWYFIRFEQAFSMAMK